MDELILELIKLLFEGLWEGVSTCRHRRRALKHSRTVIRYGGRWERPARFR